MTRLGTLAPTLLAAVALLAPIVRGDEPGPIARAIQPFVDRQALAGAVALVAGPDGVLDVEAVGYSDVAQKMPMKVDDLFWIASMNKPITSTCLMMLVDEGKVKLDDPVEKFLPEFKGQMRVVERGGDLLVLKKPARPITVKDILSHTSGVAPKSPLERELDMLTLREGAVTFALSPLRFEPGTRYEYSNGGINTAGRIIEVVSGIPYEKFLQERLLDPLGMKDTTFWPDESQVRRVAKSYRPGPNKEGLQETKIEQLTYPLTDRDRRKPYPAGGLFSTAADLSRFCRMILRGGELDGRRYLSESSVRAMTSTQTGDLQNNGKGENGYGLGWTTSKFSAGDSGPIIPGRCGHGGAYATSMDVDPEAKLVTIWLVQHAGYPLDGNKAPGVFHEVVRKTFASGSRN